MKPKLLDLYCKAGGCTRGYQEAGFYVVGVDIEPQPNYIGDEFFQADALTFPLEGFDAIHASPPCKAHTKTGWAYHSRHLDLLTPTRERLSAQPAPWVIENVPGAPLRGDVMLCGSQFGLGVRRHRYFETSPPMLILMASCDHRERVVSPHGNPNAAKGTRIQWAEAMGIDWMSAPELAQAIPPAYTKFLGEQLMQALEVVA